MWWWWWFWLVSRRHRTHTHTQRRRRRRRTTTENPPSIHTPSGPCVSLPPSLDDHDHGHDDHDHDHDDHDDQQRHNEFCLKGLSPVSAPLLLRPTPLHGLFIYLNPRTVLYCTALYLCLPKSSASSWIFWQTIQTRCVSVRSCRVTFWLLLVVCFFAMFFSCLWLVSLHPVPPRL